MQVTIIPIVIDAFETVTKWLRKGLADLEVGRRVETIQTTTLFLICSASRRDKPNLTELNLKPVLMYLNVFI